MAIRPATPAFVRAAPANAHLCICERWPRHRIRRSSGSAFTVAARGMAALHKVEGEQGSVRLQQQDGRTKPLVGCRLPADSVGRRLSAAAWRRCHGTPRRPAGALSLHAPAPSTQPHLVEARQRSSPAELRAALPAATEATGRLDEARSVVWGSRGRWAACTPASAPSGGGASGSRECSRLAGSGRRRSSSTLSIHSYVLIPSAGGRELAASSRPEVGARAERSPARLGTSDHLATASMSIRRR